MNCQLTTDGNAMAASFGRTTLSALLCACIICVCAGCSSTGGALTFDSVAYPASMSAFLYDHNSVPVVKGRELRTVHVFELTRTFWSIGYGAFPLTSGEDLSDSINAIVAAHDGVGIINLSITIAPGVVNKIYSMLLYIPSALPFVPSAADITLRGEVVKMDPTALSRLLQIQSEKRVFIPSADIKNAIGGVIDDIGH
jgi:hypothetical protein